MLNTYALSQEFVRALRGPRSQLAFSRRFGYKSNVAYAWESGRRWPLALDILQMAERLGWPVAAAFRNFFRNPPAWLNDTPPVSAQGIAYFLEDLRGKTPILRLAEASSLSRFTVSRILSGKTAPTLPDFFQLIEASSLRLIDWLTPLIDPLELPSVTDRWKQMLAQRRLMYQRPWTQAVVRMLELIDYQALPNHIDGWIAKHLGIPQDEEEECLTALLQAGLIKWDGTHWRIDTSISVDTRSDPDASQRLRSWWTGVAQHYIETQREGQFSYGVFSVSHADFERIRELHLAYFRTLRSIVAASQPAERVVVANVQLFPLMTSLNSP